MFIKGAVIFNPVLIQLVGLCPVVAASTTFVSSVVLSATLCLDLIVISDHTNVYIGKRTRKHEKLVIKKDRRIDREAVRLGTKYARNGDANLFVL